MFAGLFRLNAPPQTKLKDSTTHIGSGGGIEENVQHSISSKTNGYLPRLAEEGKLNDYKYPIGDTTNDGGKCIQQAKKYILQIVGSMSDFKAHI